MPTLTTKSHSSLTVRDAPSATPSAKPSLSDTNADTIAGVVIGIICLILFILWCRSRLLRYHAAEADKQKALQDKRNWYSSTRPIVSRPPHLPLILQEPLGASQSERSEVLWGDSDVLGKSQRIAQSVELERPKQVHIASARPSSWPGADEDGRSYRSSRQTVGTLCTVDTDFSVGIAVPVAMSTQMSAVRLETMKSLPHTPTIVPAAINTQ